MITKETKYNHLVNEKSPYLLQHVENPVDWYPWGEEAFNKAFQENKPLFLSIGYSTCHWCHVMAHESFENDAVAQLMNDTFISIKVDREERPDIDKIYMTVCQMMTGSGGWPLTILLTPDKKPFFAGTYFPKESKFGRIGLIDLIKRVKTLWINNKDELLESAEKITSSLQNLSQESPGNTFNKRILKKTYNQLLSQFDSEKGGFSERLKFPTPHNLLFLLRYWKRTKEQNAIEMVEKTLQEIRKGGIYDHIGFGIHRYSTDKNWLVPHFEKMLYDQALVALAYIEAFQATRKDIYKRTAEEIFKYVIRDMSSPEGGFYSAEDADSEGEEGKFYVWSKSELEKILGQKEFELIINTYNVTESGNYLEEATGRKTGKNILHLNQIQVIEQEDHYLKLENIRQKLFNYREKRVHPHRDDKILTDWNGLMIAALAKGAKAFSKPKYLKIAQNATDFILHYLKKEDGELLHRYRDGKAEIKGFLTDYAFFIWGLLEMFESTFNNKYLETALELNEFLLKHFWDDYIGGFYFTSESSEVLLTRQKEIYDGAIPSGNSVSMLNLLRLSYITGDYLLEEKANILSRVFTEKLEASPLSYTQFMVAADFAVGPTYSLVIAGNSKSEDTLNILEAIENEYLPNKVLILRKMEQQNPDIDKFSNFVQFFDDKDNKATAYVCINKTCKPPSHKIDKILEYLDSNWEK
ncbi:MAG: thioredoxin domain-containing protein [Candidatus Hermodarchaeota archaeon]